MSLLILRNQEDDQNYILDLVFERLKLRRIDIIYLRIWKKSIDARCVPIDS